MPNAPQQGRRQRRARRQRIANRVQHQAERRARQAESFTEPLTPKRARRVARSEAATEFRPLERQIKSEVRGSKKREGELGEWWGQVADDYGKSGQLAAQAFTTAEQATNSRLDAASKSAQDTLNSLSSDDASFAALVGGPKNATGLAQAAEAAAAAERQRATLQAPITAMRATNVSSYGSRSTAARMRGIEDRQAERSRRSKQQQDLQALHRERGQATVKNLQTLREQEQDRSTQQEALGAKQGYNRALETQSKLGLKGSQVTAAAQVAAAQAYARARERGASAQEAVAAEQKAAARVTGKAQENTAKIQGQNAGKKSGGYSVKEAKSLLRTMYGKKTVSAQRAIDSLVNRGVSYGVAVKAVRQIANGR